MSKSDLKRCPFCGSPDVVFCEDTEKYEYGDIFCIYVKCNTCMASGGRGYKITEAYAGDEDSAELAAYVDAKNMWNKASQCVFGETSNIKQHELHDELTDFSFEEEK